VAGFERAIPNPVIAPYNVERLMFLATHADDCPRSFLA